MKNIIHRIFDSNLFHKRFDGLRWYGNILYKTSNKIKGVYKYGKFNK